MFGSGGEIVQAGGTCLVFMGCRELFGRWQRSTGWRDALVDDSRVWRRIAAGDAEAFDALYRETGPRLRAFLRQLLPGEQEAEDVMQETFTQIWRRPQGFDPERGSLRGYVFGIGRKFAAEWWRGRRPTEELKEESARCAAEMSSMVADAFSQLSEEQRTILWLREVEGQSYAELAVILEIPVGTVRSRLFSAREALREVWHRERVEKGGPHEMR